MKTDILVIQAWVHENNINIPWLRNNGLYSIYSILNKKQKSITYETLNKINKICKDKNFTKFPYDAVMLNKNINHNSINKKINKAFPIKIRGATEDMDESELLIQALKSENDHLWG